MQIYIHRDGQQFGPYSAGQARDFLAAGDLLPGDLAWHDGAANWAPLCEVLPPDSETAPPQLAFVPPRRGDSSFAPQPTQRKAPIARTPVETTASTSPTSAAPSTAPTKSRRSSRGTSAKTNPIVRQQRSLGRRNMAVGGLIAIVGLVIYIGTYEAAASDPHGGGYVVAWGAVLFGGFRCVRGLVQFLQAR